MLIGAESVAAGAVLAFRDPDKRGFSFRLLLGRFISQRTKGFVSQVRFFVFASIVSFYGTSVRGLVARVARGFFQGSFAGITSGVIDGAGGSFRSAADPGLAPLGLPFAALGGARVVLSHAKDIRGPCPPRPFAPTSNHGGVKMRRFRLGGSPALSDLCG